MDKSLLATSTFKGLKDSFLHMHRDSRFFNSKCLLGCKASDLVTSKQIFSIPKMLDERIIPGLIISMLAVTG